MLIKAVAKANNIDHRAKPYQELLNVASDLTTATQRYLESPHNSPGERIALLIAASHFLLLIEDSEAKVEDPLWDETATADS